MRKDNPGEKDLQRRPWSILSALLGALLLLAATGISALPGFAAQDTPLAMARVDIRDQQELERLAASGVSIYTQFYGTKGKMILLLAAEPTQLAELQRQGYETQVLDANARGAEYYLLHGTAEALQQARRSVKILLQVSQQAVMRASTEQVELVNALGIRSMPLHPYRLAAPAPNVQLAPAIPDAISPDPFVQEMIDQVSPTTLYQYVGDLSGEWATTIDGAPFTLLTRSTGASTYITKATRYIYEHFQAMGLPPSYHTYTISSGEKRNVIAEQPGTTQPERIFLLTAHLDSTSNTPDTLAPGADDNASGSAGVLAAADILRRYPFGCTLRYVLFTGEEQGLRGSQNYASYVYSLGENIAGVLNLDMISYNTTGSAPGIDLNTRAGDTEDLVIANLFNDVIDAYQINLNPEIRQLGTGLSDHASFWAYGYTAILAIEDFSDFDPYYHSTSDRLATLNMDYFTEFTKAAVGTFAHMGCLLEGSLQGDVRDAATGNPIPGAMVEARLDATRSWTASPQPDGSYQMPLLAGNYTVTASAPSHISGTAPANIQNAQATNLDFLLQPCAAVQQVHFTFDPIVPGIGQNITFYALVTGTPPFTYEWDFGDGNHGGGEIVNHAYMARGIYPVTLTISNACSPATADQSVAVDLERYFFPILLRSTP